MENDNEKPINAAATQLTGMEVSNIFTRVGDDTEHYAVAGTFLKVETVPSGNTLSFKTSSGETFIGKQGRSVRFVHRFEWLEFSGHTPGEEITIQTGDGWMLDTSTEVTFPEPIEVEGPTEVDEAFALATDKPIHMGMAIDDGGGIFHETPLRGLFGDELRLIVSGAQRTHGFSEPVGAIDETFSTPVQDNTAIDICVLKLEIEFINTPTLSLSAFVHGIVGGDIAAKVVGYDGTPIAAPITAAGCYYILFSGMTTCHVTGTVTGTLGTDIVNFQLTEITTPPPFKFF